MLANLQTSFDDAVALHRQGKLPQAERIYGRILKVMPNHFDTLLLLAQLKMQRDKPSEALRLMTAAVAARSDIADVHVHLGMVLRRLNRHPEALASFERALGLDPQHVDAMGLRGDLLLTLGRAGEALAGFDAILAIAPGHIGARFNRGTALAALGRREDALAEFDAVLTTTAHPGAIYNRGTVLSDLHRHDEAVTAYDRLLASDPGHVGAWNNRGRSLAALNRHPEAIESFDRALALDRDYANAHHNKALALLTIGDYARGFSEYEWRWRRTGMPKPSGSRPQWLGEYPLGNKTILVTAEQGLGDTIQFARYMRRIARGGGKIILEVQPELKGLMSRFGGLSQVVGRGEPRPAFDVQCPLGSLPLAFKTETATVPVEIPYLGAEPARAARWRARMEPIKPPRIALAWAGNPAHPNDANRSIGLAALASLWTAGAARFVSLQRDLRDADRNLLKATPLVDLAAEIGDFDDTAAIVAACDLVISVDTSLAHLAGAMGRPIWIMLPFVPDWRWTLSAETSPWYPAARLFRQSRPGDWTEVVARVRRELALLAISSSSAESFGVSRGP